MKYKFKEERLYLVRFLDHCLGHDAPIPCTIVGFCVKDATDHVVLAPWVNNFTKDWYEKSEIYCVLKPMVKEIIDLRRIRPKVPQQ